MKTTKLFFDTEFTGLNQHTTLISIGIVSECGKSFYAEFTDYDALQINDWLRENVISNLTLTQHITKSVSGYEKWLSYNETFDNALSFALAEKDMSNFECIGQTEMIKNRLESWLSQFEHIEMWSDCLAYDWVLFCQIWGGAFGIPKNIYYIPFDICTLMKVRNIDPDISREEFSEGVDISFDNFALDGIKHNAMFDALNIFKCYKKITAINF